MKHLDQDVLKKKVAILIEQGVEDIEFIVIVNGLRQQGVDVIVLSSRLHEKYKGKRGKLSVLADGTTTEAIVEEYAAVVIPGGVAPDKMRSNRHTVSFVKEAMRLGKWVGTISHGIQVLIEGDLLKNKQVTGFNSIRLDIINAGANYQDKPLVVDDNLITSREIGDLSIFTTALLNRLGYGGKRTGLPDERDIKPDWWKLADIWGGSTKGDIIKGLNTALAGEHYLLESLKKYVEKESDIAIKMLFQDIMINKDIHIKSLQNYLYRFSDKPAITANNTCHSHKNNRDLIVNDNVYHIRCALRDIQTRMGDIGNLCGMYTDPSVTAIFKQIYQDLAKNEQQLLEIYQLRTRDKVRSHHLVSHSTRSR